MADNDRYAPPNNKRGLIRLGRGLFQHECPSCLITAIWQSPSEDEAPRGIALCNNEDILCAGESREDSSGRGVLEFRQNALGAPVTSVVNEIVGIPPGVARTHLSEPRPNVVGRATNGDGMVDCPDGIRNQVVARKGLLPFGSGGADLLFGVAGECHEYRCSPSHDEQEFPS